jgi:hypothetical protein
VGGGGLFTSQCQQPGRRVDPQYRRTSRRGDQRGTAGAAADVHDRLTGLDPGDLDKPTGRGK